jgi:hypothetical protein
MSFCHKSTGLSTGSFPIFEGIATGIFGAKGKKCFAQEKHLTFGCGHDTLLTMIKRL